MNIILRWFIATAAIMITAYFIPGVTVASFWVALWLAVVLGLINAILRPLLVILTLPINLLTLGLFILVINASLVMLAAYLVGGFAVSGFWVALLFSIVLSIVSYMLNTIFKIKKN